MYHAAVFTFLRNLLFVFPCFFFISANAQNNNSNENISSRWLNKMVVIDGKASEWSKNDFTIDDKAGLAYLIANDSSVLYICFEAKDEIIKTKILNAGFSLFLNGEGKKKRSYSIDYPMQNVDNNAANDPARLRDLKSLQLISFLNARIYQLSGFKKGDGLYSIDNPNDAGIKISLGVSDSSSIIYEAVVPFSAIFKKQPDLRSKDENNIAVCFSTNALAKPTNPTAQPAAGPVSGNLSAGRRFTNSNTPNVPVHGSDDMDKLFQSSKEWKIVRLAKSL